MCKPRIFSNAHIKGLERFVKRFVSSVHQEVTCFPPHYLFLLRQDHRRFPLQAVVKEKWHKAVVRGLGLCSLPAITKRGGCSTFLIKQRVESRMSASEQSKGRIKHTFCSSACVVLSLQDR